MFNQIIMLITIIIMEYECHTPKNTSDVIVTYEGHADAERPVRKTEVVTTTEKSSSEDSHLQNDDKDEVVFVPNSREIVRKFSQHHDEHEESPKISIADLMADGVNGRRSISDLLGKKMPETTETTDTDILFVSGKNNEYAEDVLRTEHKQKHKDADIHMDTDDEKKVAKKKPKKLRCGNLNCDNTVDSICGGKLEHKVWKYRLFLNDCFFRKVNCAFHYEFNRYVEVEKEKCKTVGEHYADRPSHWQESPPKKETTTVPTAPKSGRRSGHLMIDGRQCEHMCPVSCTDDYEPECARSMTGQWKVFVNHCALDYNSCTFGIVWRKRPLSECVGGKKADMQQNRAFINWMQQVGIVDNKGRLNLS